MNLKWSYSSSKSFYIGFKATVVMDYDNMNPVAILIHSGAPHDTKLFGEILETGVMTIDYGMIGELS